MVNRNSMKYTLICLVLFLTVPVFCQDSVTTTVQLLDNIRSDIKSGVVSIAEYLKEVSPMVYQATKQKIIAQGWVAVLSCAHLPVMLTICLVGTYRKWDYEGMGFLWVFAVCSFIICIVVLVLFLPQILAPDYYTIKELVEFIKP